MDTYIMSNCSKIPLLLKLRLQPPDSFLSSNNSCPFNILDTGPKPKISSSWLVNIFNASKDSTHSQYTGFCHPGESWYFADSSHSSSSRIKEVDQEKSLEDKVLCQQQILLCSLHSIEISHFPIAHVSNLETMQPLLWNAPAFCVKFQQLSEIPYLPPA